MNLNVHVFLLETLWVYSDTILNGLTHHLQLILRRPADLRKAQAAFDTL
jgi:hypothetical protein